jgi:hypothetical protein
LNLVQVDFSSNKIAQLNDDLFNTSSSIQIINFKCQLKATVVCHDCRKLTHGFGKRFV